VKLKQYNNKITVGKTNESENHYKQKKKTNKHLDKQCNNIVPT